MAISFLGLLILALIIGGVLFAFSFAIPLKRDSSVASEGSGGGSVLFLLLFLGLMACGFAGWFFFIKMKAGGIVTGQIAAPINIPEAAEVPAQAAARLENSPLETPPPPAAQPLESTINLGRIELNLRRAPEESSATQDPAGHFILEISNNTGLPISPHSLQEKAANMAWYVEVVGKSTYDSVEWEKSEFHKVIPQGQKSEFRISVPLKTIEAGPGDKLLILYQFDPDDHSQAVGSNSIGY